MKDKNRTEQALLELGYTLDIEGMNEEAEQMYLKAIEMLEDKTSNQDLEILSTTAFEHGKKLYNLKRYDQALAAFKRSKEILDSLVILDANHLVIEKLANSISWYARSLRKLNKFQRAANEYQRACSIWGALRTFSPDTEKDSCYALKLGLNMYGLSKCLKSKNDYELADLAMYSAKSLLGNFNIAFE